MRTYSLTIQVDDVGRRRLLQFKETIGIVRAFVDPDPYRVVCVTFNPFGQDNTVQFVPEHYLYASPQTIATFATINMAIKQQVSAGNTYTFRQGNFSGEEAGILNKYGFDNQAGESATLATGLAQKILMPNGSDQIVALNIAAVPYNQTIYVEPKNQIFIFVATDLQDGLILPAKILKPSARSVIISRYLAIDFNVDPSPVIHYDNTSNAFASGPLPT